jgi:hypothetical protein
MTRKILIAVAVGGVCAGFGCGSSGSGTTGQGVQVFHSGAIADLVTPPGDPNAPPGDPNAPSGDSNTPPGDPNAPPPDPNAPPGGGPPPGRTCSSFCAGIDSACADGCTQLCSELDQPVTVCAGILTAVRACVSTNGLVCANGKVRVTGDQCNEEGRALLSCASPPTPNGNGGDGNGNGGQPNGNGGQPNGNGGQNNGGGQCSDLCASIDAACSQSCPAFCNGLDAFPSSCSDAVATAKSCIMNAGLTCNNGAPAPANNACVNELSALSSCAPPPPMGSGGTGP